LTIAVVPHTQLILVVAPDLGQRAQRALGQSEGWQLELGRADDKGKAKFGVRQPVGVLDVATLADHWVDEQGI